MCKRTVSSTLQACVYFLNSPCMLNKDPALCANRDALCLLCPIILRQYSKTLLEKYRLNNLSNVYKFQSGGMN